MSTAALTSYDEVPYGNYVFSYTHPDRLGALAVLHGMTPAPVERCRVLELGCGTGANLIPMASRFTSRAIIISCYPRRSNSTNTDSRG